ncbi:MAG TPA: VCBS repeat-containing protein [Cyclobacteriaceae bacterium]|nr:VCBS repeat-containing protein [Cyclobacteriaceae bacterium]
MRRTFWVQTLALAGWLLSACTSSSNQSNTLFQQILPPESGIDFENTLEESAEFNIIEYLYFYNGGGVAIGDVNQDGLADLFFTSNQGPNKLFINQGDFHFKDVTESAGIAKSGNWSTGVTMADVNGDGWLDIYVCGVGGYKQFNSRNQLWINNQNGTFTNMASAFGLDFQGLSTQASFFDYDNDGDLDVYLLNHSVHSVRSYGRTSSRLDVDPAAGDRLFRNELNSGVARFTDMTGLSGIYSSALGYGLGVSTSDIDMDGWTDIYVSNDFRENDYLYLNNHDGTFREVSASSLGHTSRFSMGNDVGDINNDGFPDIITTDMMPADEQVIKASVGEDSYEIYKYKLSYGFNYQVARNALQLNQGDGTFSDIGWLAGVAATDWSWSPLLVDFDNDGSKDVFISNGIMRRPNDLDYLNFISNDSAQRLSDEELYRHMPPGKVGNFVFRNRGDLTFENQSASWGLNQPGYSNGAAYGDLNNDGFIDLVINNINEPAGIFKNTQVDSSKRGLTVTFKGYGGNQFGVNTKVFAFAGGSRQYYEVGNARGFQSCSDHRLNLTTRNGILDSLWVIWPDGLFESRQHPTPHGQLAIDHGDATGKFDYHRLLPSTTILKSVTSPESPVYRHRENDYVSFNEQGLMPHMVSAEGPPLAVGDINGDGMEDLFIGGGPGQSGTVYQQNRTGKFLKMKQPALEADSAWEDTGALLFDANGDHHLDLLVVAGGDENLHSFLYQPRLYLGNQQGIFKPQTKAFPQLSLNASCVKGGDMDGDGDIDLFIGARSVPGKYGVFPLSFILENNGDGKFTDVSVNLPGGNQALGLVTDAAWLDLDKNGRMDLLVVGEWMSPKLLMQDGSGHFRDASIQYGLDKLEGWWNSLTVADTDQDGDLDFVAGNLGLNSRLRASLQEPLEMWVGDFDNNGSTEQLLTYYNQGISYPFVSRDQLVKQLPGLRKKFLKYEKYTRATIHDILDEEQRNRAIHLKAVELQSCYFNNRNGHFKVTPLPQEAQVFPIRSAILDDLNKDGYQDLLAVGNRYATQPDFGRYDAGRGLLMLGSAQGFTALTPTSSGFNPVGDTRVVIAITASKNGKIYIVSGNNAQLQTFHQ